MNVLRKIAGVVFLTGLALGATAEANAGSFVLDSSAGTRVANVGRGHIQVGGSSYTQPGSGAHTNLAKAKAYQLHSATGSAKVENSKAKYTTYSTTSVATYGGGLSNCAGVCD